MPFTSYQSISTNTASLNTGSYLNQTEYSMFVGSYSPELWYGYSPNDAIELGVWGYDNSLINWGVISQSNNYSVVNSSYTNEVGLPTTYSYSSLLTDFELYKHEKILVNPPLDLSSSFSITSGSFVLTYNFVRNVAGNIQSPLIIKEISPSRKEIKLVPLNGTDEYYDAFCLKKVLLSDVIPAYLAAIDKCPYDQIYGSIKSAYMPEINTLKSAFFLTTDADVVKFIRNLNEDVLLYYNNITDITRNNSDGIFTRIQGIKTYFSNYILSHSKLITTFQNIDNLYIDDVLFAVNRKLSVFGKSQSSDVVNATNFLKDFFVKYYYQQISDIIANTYNAKYYAALKNAINFGNNRLLPIINHDNLDERQSDVDALTLIVKLSSELPNDIAVQSPCWISNVSIAPYIINAIIKSNSEYKTVKIGPPNFSAYISDIKAHPTNASYTADDLYTTNDSERELVVSKKIGELNVDYSDFTNFIVFSSAELRVKIFRNKYSQISTLSSSIQALEVKNSQYLIASGSLYPYYTEEHASLQTKFDETVNSFDGYESYLYRLPDQSAIIGLEESARLYDRNNRDNLINGAPKHILLDVNNDDYIVFLSMVGHFFDNIYIYISSLPTETKNSQNSTGDFTRRVVDYMLETFGWTLDDTLEQTSLINNYLTFEQVDSLNALSSEERLTIVRNRLLTNLPSIYKTKGTGEAVRLILACYGIPSSLLSIREYGGINYNSTADYTAYERAYMYRWDGTSKYEYLQVGLPSEAKTYTCKVSINKSDLYSIGKDQILFGSVLDGIDKSDVSGSGQWAVGFSREPRTNTGKIFFRIGYKDNEKLRLDSPSFPLFDGNVYSIMVRRNVPNAAYESSSDINTVPCTYDLWVKQNSFGNRIVSLSSSALVVNPDTNRDFNLHSSNLMIGGWFADHNDQAFVGAMDKLQVWYDPISDDNFNEYANSINAYSFDGLRKTYQSLLFRMHTDYPFDVRTSMWKNGNYFYASGSQNKQQTYLNISEPADMDQLSGSNIRIGTQHGSSSAYPFQFEVIDYPSIVCTSKYGPNKFRNEKLQYVSQSALTRLDSHESSTISAESNVAPDSNQIGFFIDPNDFKNTDIIRYFGNYNFMEVIGDPNDRFSSEYNGLKPFRQEYADSKLEYSGSRTLVGELMTLYKLYFNQSIFEVIHNVLPARANVLSGVLIEPTVLERSKYQAKEINSEVNSGSAYYGETTAAKYFRDPNTKIMRISQSVEYGTFNVDSGSNAFNYNTLPHNYSINLDISKINDVNHQFPVNYCENGTYIPDLPDLYQFGHFGTSPDMLLDDGTYGKIPMDMNASVTPTNTKSYLLKRWKKYSISIPNGGNVINPAAPQTTNSIYLYDYIVVSNTWFVDMVYTASVINNVNGGPDFEYGSQWTHKPNTFKDRPNSTTNEYLYTKNGIRYTQIQLDPPEYFEIAVGYPRNHHIHKRDVFSLYTCVNSEITTDQVVENTFVKCRQTINTTVNEAGDEDGSLPVIITHVGDANLLTNN